MPPSPLLLLLMLLLLSLPLLVLLLYGQQRRAMGDRWCAVGVAAMGNGGRHAMVMGGERRAIGGWMAGAVVVVVAVYVVNDNG